MAVFASDETPTGSYDVCVVGAGPVGLAFAMEAAERGSRVLLVDAGDLDSGTRDVVPGPTEILDDARHAPIELVTRQGIGGTSWLWGGRVVAFEPIDFEAVDDRPVDVIVGLLMPHGRDAENLVCLASVTRRLRDKALAARIRTAPSAAAMYQALIEEPASG